METSPWNLLTHLVIDESKKPSSHAFVRCIHIGIHGSVFIASVSCTDPALSKKLVFVCISLQHTGTIKNIYGRSSSSKKRISVISEKEQKRQRWSKKNWKQFTHQLIYHVSILMPPPQGKSPQIVLVKVYLGLVCSKSVCSFVMYKMI